MVGVLKVVCSSIVGSGPPLDPRGMNKNKEDVGRFKELSAFVSGGTLSSGADGGGGGAGKAPGA